MKYEEVLILARSLSQEDQLQLVVNLTQPQTGDGGIFRGRGKSFTNRQVPCPHYGGKHYKRSGKTGGSQRFKRHDCGKTFTEYAVSNTKLNYNHI
ncbi:MAG: hypothetical protein LBG96_12185 [Tannerella sp.]|jgi:hypothetical protein|nr:hypothetical protein [Tannerella sp.]